MTTGAVATSYYLYNKSTDFNFIKLSTTADCASLTYKTPSEEQVAKCKNDLLKFIGERRNIAPLMIRLSWHDAGTYDEATKTGGPRAVMRFDFGESKHGANAGLAIARDLLAPIKAKHPHISNADLWSLAAICAIKVMGGPDIAWRAGRPDACCDRDAVPDGRLPDATQGCPHLRSVFHRMGMSD